MYFLIHLEHYIKIKFPFKNFKFNHFKNFYLSLSLQAKFYINDSFIDKINWLFQ